MRKAECWRETSGFRQFSRPVLAACLDSATLTAATDKADAEQAPIRWNCLARELKKFAFSARASASVHRHSFQNDFPEELKNAASATVKHKSCPFLVYTCN